MAFPAEVIAARKNELPPDEIIRQTATIREFAENEPRAVLVSTMGTVEQARDDVLTVMRDACARNI